MKSPLIRVSQICRRGDRIRKHAFGELQVKRMLAGWALAERVAQEHEAALSKALGSLHEKQAASPKRWWN